MGRKGTRTKKSANPASPKATVRIEEKANKDYKAAAKMVKESMQDAADSLEKDPQSGVFLGIHGIHPDARRDLEKRAGDKLANLWKINIGAEHRAIYTIITQTEAPGDVLDPDEPTRVVLILFFGDHKAYDRIMRYRGTT